MSKPKGPQPYELEDYTDGEILLLRFESRETADYLLSVWRDMGKEARQNLGKLQRVGGRNKPRTGTYNPASLVKMHVITLDEIQAVAPQDLMAFQVKHGLYEEDRIIMEIDEKMQAA